MIIMVLLMIIMVLLICYTRPAPEVGESWADLRLPFYTSGFE